MKSDNSKLVLINDAGKFIFDTVEAGELVISAEESAAVPAADYSYQLLDETGVVDEGTLRVNRNFALEDSTTYKTHWRVVLDAIDAQLAGRATSAQTHVTVGDKQIGYCSLNELLALRDFVKGKIAEEDGVASKMDQHTIRYAWRGL